MKQFIIVSIFLALVACATPEQRAARKQLVDQQDHQECLNLGFKAKTNAYGDCRLRIKEMRVQAQRQAIYPSFGIGYGYHHRGHHW